MSMLLLKAIWGYLIANKPKLQSTEDLTTVYVLKWVVFVLAGKGVGLHCDDLLPWCFSGITFLSNVETIPTKRLKGLFMCLYGNFTKPL